MRIEEDHAEGDHRCGCNNPRGPAQTDDDASRLGDAPAGFVQDAFIDPWRYRTGWLEEVPQVLAEPVRHLPVRVIELSVVLSHNWVLLPVKHARGPKVAWTAGFFPVCSDAVQGRFQTYPYEPRK